MPHTHVRRSLDGAEFVATHTRTWSRGQQIKDPAHVAALVAEKREAHQHRGMDRLQQAAPHSHSFVMRCAEREQDLGSTTYQLGRLSWTDVAPRASAAGLR